MATHECPGMSGFDQAILQEESPIAQARMLASVLDALPRDTHGQVDASALSIGGWDHVFVAAVLSECANLAEGYAP